MEWISLLIGGAQIAVGVAGYGTSDPEHRSLTALIPAAFGLIIALSGAVVAIAPSTRKHAMHAAATAALLGVVLVGGRAAIKFPDGGLKLASFGVTLLLNVIFLILAIRSFVEARRARERAAVANGTRTNP